MGKFRIIANKKNGIIKFKVVVGNLQKSLLFIKKPVCDAKEGHFTVIAIDDKEFKRFVVPLSYLTHPSFLKLLEQAAKEYGFDHGGAITIPCRSGEFERIIFGLGQVF